MTDNPKTTKYPTYDALIGPFNRIENLRGKANRERDKLLRDYGWQATCDTPGSVWLWQKTLPDGRTLLVDSETAFNLSWREALTKVDPDELDD